MHATGWIACEKVLGAQQGLHGEVRLLVKQHRCAEILSPAAFFENAALAFSHMFIIGVSTLARFYSSHLSGKHIKACLLFY